MIDIGGEMLLNKSKGKTQFSLSMSLKWNKDIKTLSRK